MTTRAKRPSPIILSSDRRQVESVYKPPQIKVYPQEHEEYYRKNILPLINVRVFNKNHEMTELIPGVWLGDSRDAIDRESLRKKGVDCVVNCASGNTLTNKEYYEKHWMYKEYEAIDNPDYELVKKHLDDFIDFVDECRREKRSVIVHCVAGINRSAALCVGYLVEREKMSLKDAIALCFEKRPFILTNEHFVMQLIERFI